MTDLGLAVFQLLFASTSITDHPNKRRFIITTIFSNLLPTRVEF